jgi:L-lactate dehydrogenase complex protein LldG
VDRFVEEAENLACQVHRARDEKEALATVLSLLAGETAIACWAPDEIPLPGLAQGLEEAGIDYAETEDAAARVGLSGAQTALAATGSLVLSSGSGRSRTTSLLPSVHVAVLREEQIVPDLESWLGSQREDSFAAMRQASNIVVISGPSRTADIAMELVMGMHGPRELHIVIYP